jgi:hypothetical protein
MTLSGNGGIRTPAPPCEAWPSGLLSAAELDTRADNTFFRGLEFDELCASGAPHVSAMQCPPPVEELHKESRRGFDTEYSDAFVIYAGYDCSTGGSQVDPESWDYAEQLLEGGWRWALERAFWLGEDQNGEQFRMSLKHGGATDLTPGGGAVTLTDGVAMLERYMSGFPCRPTVHARVDVATYLAERIWIKDGVTPAGSKLAFGAGYDGSSPAGKAAPAADETWLYATGGIRITTGPMFFAPDRGDLGGAVDMSVNDATVFAEKGFAIQIGCAIAAVRVGLASCCQ